jgi:hypothetical protein
MRAEDVEGYTPTAAYGVTDLAPTLAMLAPPLDIRLAVQ